MSDVNTQTTTSSQQQIEIERSSDYRKIYTNLFRYRITPSDISVTFQAIVDKPGFPIATLKVSEEAEITMSHGQTKNLVIHLSKLIAAFEKEFGPIKTTAGPTDDAINSMIVSLKTLGFG